MPMKYADERVAGIEERGSRNRGYEWKEKGGFLDEGKRKAITILSSVLFKRTINATCRNFIYSRGLVYCANRDVEAERRSVAFGGKDNGEQSSGYIGNFESFVERLGFHRKMDKWPRLALELRSKDRPRRIRSPGVHGTSMFGFRMQLVVVNHAAKVSCASWSLLTRRG